MDYKEKLEKAKELLQTANADQRYVLENLFPELAESEDERIRKEFCKDIWTFIPNEKAHKYIAWLEKQSNTIPDECVFRPVDGCDIESAAKQAIKQQGVLAKKIVLAFNGAYIPVGGKAADIIVNEYNSWLEKQGEQKVTTVDFNAKDWYVSKVDGKIHNIYHSVDKAKENDVVKCLINGMKFYYEDNEEATWGTEKFSMKVKDILSWLEKQSGIDNCHLEGSTNTVMTDSKKNQVEPKFKVGDIIKFKTKDGYSEPWQIIQVDMLDKKYRLKDGYVLHFSEEDAYELVEQKAADKVEPKFKVGDWVILAASTTLQIVKVDIDKRRYWFNDNSYLPIVDEECLYHWTIQDAKDGDVLQLGEVTAIFKKYIGQEKCICYCSVCEGEFEIPFENGEDNIYGCTNTTPATKEQRDTLFAKMNEEGYEWNAEKKELKLLVTNGGDFESENCEQKPAWSREDEQNLNVVLGFIADEYLRRWLKDVIHTKYDKPTWSEEDEKNLQGIINAIKELRCQSLLSEIEIYDDYIDWLKSLKQKYAWKPSDEQMDAFEQVYDWYNNNFAPSETLTSLYNDLKKLKG